MKTQLFFSIAFFMAISMILNAQDNLEVDGDAEISGRVTSNGLTSTGSALISGSSPVMISTTGTTVLDLRGNNPLVEFRDNAANYLAFLQCFGTDYYISNRQAGRMLFRTNNSDRMTITAAGNVGIGTTTSSSKLTVNGFENDGTIASIEVLSGAQKLIMDGNEIDCTSGGLHLNYNSETDLLVRTNTRFGEMTVRHGLGSGVSNGFALVNPGANNAYWTVYSTNNDGALELYYKGAFRGEFNSTTGAYTNVSDRRLKENVRPLTGVLSRVKALKPSSYTFKDDAEQKAYLGFMAQDVMELFPEVVTQGAIGDSGQEIFTMDYSALSVIALAAVQELAQERNGNQALSDENQLLKSKIEALEERLVRLEKLVSKD